MIISRQDINDYCRSCSTDDTIANGYIFDVESSIIKPALGVRLFHLLEDEPDQYNDLLFGCEWEDETGEAYFHEGLVRVESYYAYSKILRSSGVTATRYGVVTKDSDSSHASGDNQAVAVSNQIKIQADIMFERVLAYCKFNGLIKDNKKNNPRIKDSVRVIKIGE